MYFLPPHSPVHVIYFFQFGIEEKENAPSWFEVYKSSLYLLSFLSPLGVTYFALCRWGWEPHTNGQLSEHGRVVTCLPFPTQSSYMGILSKQTFSLLDLRRTHYFEIEILHSASKYMGIGVALASTKGYTTRALLSRCSSHTLHRLLIFSRPTQLLWLLCAWHHLEPTSW